MTNMYIIHNYFLHLNLNNILSSQYCFWGLALEIITTVENEFFV